MAAPARTLKSHVLLVSLLVGLTTVLTACGLCLFAGGGSESGGEGGKGDPPAGGGDTGGQTDATIMLEWMFGPERLASPTPPNADLVLIPKDRGPAPSTPKPSPSSKLAAGDMPMNFKGALSECIRATSVLPMPRDDGRILLAVDGAVHLLDRESKTTSPLSSNMDRSMRVDRLLASRVFAGSVEVLASVQIKGRSKPLVFALLVQSNRIVTADLADLRYDEASVSAYWVPRCTPYSRECLRIGNDDDTIYLEPWGSRNAGRSAIAVIDGVVDATWAPTGDGSMYVLKKCP